VRAKVRICSPSQSFSAFALGFLLALRGGLCTLAPAGFASLVQVESPTPQATSAMPGQIGVPPGTKIVAALQTALDVLATRSGDEIAARITKNFKRGGQTLVQKGDRLVGRVTSVRPQNVGKGENGSEVAIVFDRLTSGKNTYRLNTVIHSVLWIPGQGGGTETGTNPTQASARRLRGPHAGTSGGLGVTEAEGGAGRAGEKAGNNGGYPRGGEGPPNSIEVRSRPAPDGRAGGASVVIDHQGNLRLSAGTRLDFRTQGQ